MNSTNYDSIEIGAALPELQAEEITREQLRDFGEASGDMNPIHLDDEAAKAIGMGGVVAHGMLNMAQLGRLLTNWAPQSALRRFEVRFLAVSRPGDKIVCSGRIVEKSESNGEKRVRIEIEAATSEGNKVLQGAAVVALA